MMTNK